jgi:hypothetical protein
MKCSVDGCSSQVRAGGMCQRHYDKHRRHGDPLFERELRSDWLIAHSNHRGDECLIWPFARGADGYAIASFEGVNSSAHRAMCKIAHGPPPTAKHEAAHSCGKGHLGCVNPGHLSWKTSAENKADMIAHGTALMGERHGMARLTEADVRAIWDAKGSVSQAALARLYGVTPTTINNIYRRVIWRHMEPKMRGAA